MFNKTEKHCANTKIIWIEHCEYVSFNFNIFTYNNIFK